MDYDEIFNQDINIDFFYNNAGYDGLKLLVGKASLENAMKRFQDKSEVFTLVTYYEGDILPECYAPVTPSFDTKGTLFATFNPDGLNQNLSYICNNGGIQMVSRLSNSKTGSPTYLLGPGPDRVELFDLVGKQIDNYAKKQAEMNEQQSRTL